MIKPMKHQSESLVFMKPRKRVFDMSEPGTGKTIVAILDYLSRWKKNKKRLMVFCPKSLMTAAWANDIKKAAPLLKINICTAKNRRSALTESADVYIINHDGVKDLLKMKPAFWKEFETLVIDESTAFKHNTSARSKAMAKVAKNFQWRRLLSGTPDSNGICDLWHQFFILDDGKRLGQNFFQFRSAACMPEIQGKPQWVAEKNRDGTVKRDADGEVLMKQIARTNWVDKPGIENVVAAMVADVVIRHELEECIDIPKNHSYPRVFELSDAHMKKYKHFVFQHQAEFDDSMVTAVNKAVLRGKLLQIASGAVYNDDGDGAYSLIESERYQLAVDILEERKHSVCFYLWKHQLDLMTKECARRGISFVVWDPDKPQIEQEFQAGFYQVLFGHPKSVGHGLTLTRGRTTLWPSPTDDLEWWMQGLRRVYRNSQKFKTENIVLVAKDTVDEKAWENCNGKKKNMDNFFEGLAQ